jgi:hypothetical protein
MKLWTITGKRILEEKITVQYSRLLADVWKKTVTPRFAAAGFRFKRIYSFNPKKRHSLPSPFSEQPLHHIENRGQEIPSGTGNNS